MSTSIRNRTGLDLLADLERAGSVTKVSFFLPADTSYETWEAIGELLTTVVQVTPWLIGDWYVFGEAAFGTRAEGATLTGLHEDTISTYAWVCRKVAADERREELKLSHHRLVATMTPAKRKVWLDRAIAKGWRTRDLRAALLAADAVERKSTGDSDQPPSEESPVYTPREALTAIRADETWRRVADSALQSLNGKELCCPSCGHVWSE